MQLPTEDDGARRHETASPIHSHRRHDRRRRPPTVALVPLRGGRAIDEPTLEDGDYLITRRRYSHPCASHALTRSTAGLGRGDIIVFPDEGARYLVKRIVGLPDERVVISGGVVTINGRTLAEPWWHGATTPDGAWEGSPDGYFVMGDNRSASSDDSRSRGSIPATSIDSVVIGRYWPPDRIGPDQRHKDRRA